MSGKRTVNFVCYSEDTYRDRRLTLNEECALEAHCGQRRRNNGGISKDLPYQIELSINVQVMITENVEDLDITNGARETIVDILRAPDEPPRGPEPIIKPPAYIRIKFAQLVHHA